MSNALTRALGGAIDLVVKSFMPVPGAGGYSTIGSWNQLIQEPFTGAWQRNAEIKVDDATRHFAVWSCITQISSDVAKLPFVFKVKKKSNWQSVDGSRYSWLQSRPNYYQTPIQFRENWLLSKLQTGNTYVLKQRNPMGRVEQLFVLDPTKVKALVVPTTGEVFYEIATDILAGNFGETLVVPASEIIHDRFNCKNHPLVGMSPLYAAGLSAMAAIHGHQHMINFLKNQANPGGILTAPGAITQLTVDNLKEYFSTNFSGAGAGKIAVVGDGLKFERLAMSSADAQLIQHLRWSAENICAVYHVPSYMIIGTTPGSNVEAMKEQYYSQCLQVLIAQMQECLDLGLDVPEDESIELDQYELLRGDMTSRFNAYDKAIKGSFMTINEARAREDLEPKEGGDTIWMQQQNYSLEALSERDRTNPLGLPVPAPGTVQEEPEDEDKKAPEPKKNPDEQQEEDGDEARSLLEFFKKSLDGENYEA